MLRTDFKDDVFDGNRKYNMINNPDGTVSLIDATEYAQEGDALSADDVNTISEAVNQAFQSASNGKQAIKNAITGVDPEVIIPTDPTFAQLATAIGDIETGIDTSDATATAGDIVAPKTAYGKDGKMIGTMPDRGTVNHSLPINGSYTIPSGKHSGSGKVTQDIPTKGAETITPGTTNKIIGAGQYLSGAQTILGDPDLVPSKIPEDLNLFGVQGARKLGKKFATGIIGPFAGISGPVNVFRYGTNSSGPADYYYMTVSGLDFGPSIIRWFNNLYDYSGLAYYNADANAKSISINEQGKPYMFNTQYTFGITSNGFVMPTSPNAPVSNQTWTWEAWE